MTLLAPRKIQTILKQGGYYDGRIDGLIGHMSNKAVNLYLIMYVAKNGKPEHLSVQPMWSDARSLVAFCQIQFKEKGFYSGEIDGLSGPNTMYALERWQDMLRDEAPLPCEVAHLSGRWPEYRSLESFFGAAGTNLETFEIPYALQLAWDTDVSVTRITMNRKVKHSVLGVMESLKKDLGLNVMRDLGLLLYGGAYNMRLMRGGSQLSTHAYGIAIDFDPLRNALRATSATATFARTPEYNIWWRAWESAGWVSLGRERNYDWMHVQACRL